MTAESPVDPSDSSAGGSAPTLTEVLRADRTLAVVRAPSIPDAAELAAALTDGGIRALELTFTTPDVLRHLRRVAETAAEHGALIGVGTVCSADQARAAIDVGAQFLVTPGIRPAVAQVATDAGIPISLGALSPSEVMQALDLGSGIVKIFPARLVGPGYIKDLRGPFPDISLLPSGGIDASNARSYLDAGALAVCCGTSVVSPQEVAAGAWSAITAKARDFRTAL